MPGSLASIRRFGYRGVEFAGFYGWGAAEIRRMLHDTYPIALLRRDRGRAWSIHVKDCRPGQPDLLLGSSDFDWRSLFHVCEAVGGTRWYVIEHESKDLPALAAVDESLKRFHQLRRG